MTHPIWAPLRLAFGDRRLLYAWFFQGWYSAFMLLGPSTKDICGPGHSPWSCELHWFVTLETSALGVGTFWALNAHSLFLPLVDAHTLRLPERSIIGGVSLLVAMLAVCSLVIPALLLWPYLDHWALGLRIFLLGAIGAPLFAMLPRVLSAALLGPLVALFLAYPDTFVGAVVRHSQMLWIVNGALLCGVVVRWKWLAKKDLLETTVRKRFVSTPASLAKSALPRGSVNSSERRAVLEASWRRLLVAPHTLAIRTMLGPPFRVTNLGQFPWTMFMFVAAGLLVPYFVAPNLAFAFFDQLMAITMLPLGFAGSLDRMFVGRRAEFVELSLVPGIAPLDSQHAQLLFAVTLPPICHFAAATAVQCVLICVLNEPSSGYLLSIKLISLLCVATVACNIFVASQDAVPSRWIHYLPTALVIAAFSSVVLSTGMGAPILRDALSAHPWWSSAGFLVALLGSFVMAAFAVRRLLSRPHPFLPYE